MANTIVSVKPEFGVNYKVGYIGFTFTDNSFISKGIAWFTRWEKGEHQELPKINISHVVIVTGENECIEATSPRVKKTPLSEYFDNPHIHICFRKPTDLNDEIGKRMVATAETKLGKKYDYILLVGHLLTNNIVGRLFSKVLGKRYDAAVTGFFNNRNAYICSEYAAYVLNEQPEYHSKGILADKAADIDPQELFQDLIVFGTWSEQVNGKIV